MRRLYDWLAADPAFAARYRAAEARAVEAERVRIVADFRRGQHGGGVTGHLSAALA